MPAAEVLLEPLDRGDIEMVRRLVEQEEIRLGDDEPRERGPRLLPAGQGGRRLGPFVAGEPEAGQGLVDAVVEGVAAEDVELVLEVRIAGRLDVAGVLHLGQPGRHRLEMGRSMADRCPEVRSGHERVVEMGLLGEQAERQAALPVDGARVRLVAARRQAEQGRLARSVGPDQADPVVDGDRGRHVVEDHERADLAPDAIEAKDRHGQPPTEARAAARRVAAARLVRSERAARMRSRLSASRLGPVLPSPPGSSDQRRPVRFGVVIVRRIARAPGRSEAGRRWHHEQKCVARPPTTIRRIGRPQRRHGSPVRW